MPYRICKTIDIENGHMLAKHPELCRFPHGHTRRVELILEADELDANEMVCDFKVLKLAVSPFLATLDHALCMNTDDPAYPEFKARFGERVIGFDQQDPTTEVLARTIFEHAAKALADYMASSAEDASLYPLDKRVRIVSVRLWETATSWAEFVA
jgi:6-pyruvoyltetrahydropterin/6-carboxytetrahydropterin synthase